MKSGAMFKTKRASEIRTPAFLPKMWNVSVSADTRDHLIFLRTLRSCPNRRSFRDGNAFVLAVRLLLAGLSALSDVDAALEVRAIFNRNACRNDVAGERTIAANIHAVAGGQVAANFSQHHNFAGIHIGRNHAVASHRYAIAGKVDRPFHAA